MDRAVTSHLSLILLQFLASQVLYSTLGLDGISLVFFQNAEYFASIPQPGYMYPICTQSCLSCNEGHLMRWPDDHYTVNMDYNIIHLTHRNCILIILAFILCATGQGGSSGNYEEGSVQQCIHNLSFAMR